MAKKPKRLCRGYGCGKLTEAGWCDECRKKYVEHRKKGFAKLDKNRESASKRGYGRLWRESREWFLNAKPSCVKCLEHKGQNIPATVVDHIVPHRGDMRLFWDQSNWQALCKKCHDVKTAIGQ